MVEPAQEVQLMMGPTAPAAPEQVEVAGHTFRVVDRLPASVVVIERNLGPGLFRGEYLQRPVLVTPAPGPSWLVVQPAEV